MSQQTHSLFSSLKYFRAEYEEHIERKGCPFDPARSTAWAAAPVMVKRKPRSAFEMERAERQQFVEWLRESHIHVTEMLRVAQIHGSLEQFSSDASDVGCRHHWHRFIKRLQKAGNRAPVTRRFNIPG